MLRRQVTQETKDVGSKDILHVCLVRGELAFEQGVDHQSLLLEEGIVTLFGRIKRSWARRFIDPARVRENWFLVTVIFHLFLPMLAGHGAGLKREVFLLARVERRLFWRRGQ
jgi:hypothetical protein